MGGKCSGRQKNGKTGQFSKREGNLGRRLAALEGEKSLKKGNRWGRKKRPSCGKEPINLEKRR